MSEGIDIVREVLTRAKDRRGKALIALTENYSGQQSWAKELAKQVDADHIDLLEYFTENKEMAGKVGSTNVEELFALLPGLSDKSILVVSGIEFLRATWSGYSGANDEFCHRVETWEKQPALVFVTQSDKSFENRKSARFGHQYSFNQKDTFALI